METFDELKSATENINYYADKIDSLTREQFNYDCENCEMITDATNRLDLLGAIGGATRYIKLLCEQIASNLKNAQAVKLPVKIAEGEQEELL